MDTITRIAAKASHQLRVTQEDDRVIITAPTVEERWSNEPLFWLNALNSDDWYQVPVSTKVEVRGFGIDAAGARSLAWMREYFGNNFTLA